MTPESKSHATEAKAHATTEAVHHTHAEAVHAAPLKQEAPPVASVGRVIHFVNNGGECEAAIVNAVGTDPARIGVTVFPPGGVGTSWRDIPLQDATTRTPGTWHWPETT